MSYNVSSVKAKLLQNFSALLDELLRAASTGKLTAREAEVQTWRALIPLGLSVLASVLGCLCLHATKKAVAEVGLSMGDVRLRLDGDYLAKFNTTLGRICFPWFAFRDGQGRTHAPARALFSQYPRIRSSELLLEWECALGADHPFRKAAEALLFFSHGAADVEDTTIERHALLLGNAVPVEWLYKTPEQIRDILEEKATRDNVTDRPIVYASTDAHALKRFVGRDLESEVEDDQRNSGMVCRPKDWEDPSPWRRVHVGGLPAGGGAL